MKLTRILLIVCAALLLQGGCATNQVDVRNNVEKAIPYLRPAAALVAANALNFVPESEKVATTNWLYSVAHLLHTLSGGKAPTPEDFKQAINQVTPDSSKWAVLATSLSSIYGGVYPNIRGDGKLVLQVLEGISAGIEDAAAPYLVHATPSPQPTP